MKEITTVLVGMLATSAALAQTSGGPTSAGTPAALRVGVVHVERLLQESTVGKEALGRIQKLGDQKREEANRLSRELLDLEKKLDAQGGSLSDSVRESLRKVYEDKTIAFRRFQDDAARELESARTKELGEFEKRLVPMIQQVGREQNFSLIFNWTQAGLVYADTALDVTNDVLLAFNQSVGGMTLGTRDKSKTPPAATPNPR